MRRAVKSYAVRRGVKRCNLRLSSAACRRKCCRAGNGWRAGVGHGRCKATCGEVGRNGVKKWYRVRERGGGGGGGGFEAGDTSGDVLDEIVTSAKAFGFGRFGGPGR